MKKLLIVVAALMIIIVNNKSKDELIIPDTSIRFRVIANSNTLEDINEKNKLSNYLDTKIFEFVKNSTSVTEAKQALTDNKTKISSIIDEYLLNNMINYGYDLAIGENYFPTKYYKGVKYKAGYYDSIVIKLGSSSGMNWWCVIYPPLCLIDEENNKDIEYTSLIKEVMEKYKNRL